MAADDDLNKPLGMDGAPQGSRRARLVVVGACVGLVSMAFVVAAVSMLGNARGGEPFAVASIAPPRKAAIQPQDQQRDRKQTNAPDAVPPPAAANVGSAVAGGALENGVRVFRTTKTAEPERRGPLVIKVPEALGQSEVAAVDRRLIEVTRYGPLPRISADGARASDVYARPPVFGGTIRPGAPRIAIVVEGIDPDRAAMNAVEGLPPAVSLAFAATAEHLDEAVARAKAAGHEVLLQLSMQLDDESDRSAPHRLLVDAPQTKMVDDLHWLMSRMTGYVGVMNAQGGPFTADKTAMTLMLREVGERGLLYADDGSSRRSLGPTLASSLGVPTTRADVVLDASTDPAAMQAAFVRLEATARARGEAVGVGAALPATCKAIAEFAATFAAKGLALVPISSLTRAAVPVAATTP